MHTKQNYLLFMAICIGYFVVTSASATNTCATPGCTKASSLIRSYMNENEDPCEDFYAFACGKFVRDTRIPQDKSIYNTFSILQDKVDEEIKTVLTLAPQANESNAFRLAKIFTKTCLDERKLNEQGRESYP